jgi:ABC-type lipoprotein release transport system permease subunit
MVLTWMLWRVMASTIRVNGEGEPWALVAVTGLLLIVVVCAAVGPARHAARTEPMAALRSE